jgi:hypothetical protein
MDLEKTLILVIAFSLRVHSGPVGCSEIQCYVDPEDMVVGDYGRVGVVRCAGHWTGFKQRHLQTTGSASGLLS